MTAATESNATNQKKLQKKPRLKQQKNQRQKKEAGRKNLNLWTK